MERNIDEYIAGFVDGEGCFGLTLRRDVRRERLGSPVYFHWKAMFAIELRADDANILHVIRNRFDCGAVTAIPKRNVIRYQVAKISDLHEIIAPFFEAHPLIGRKETILLHGEKQWKFFTDKDRGVGSRTVTR